MKKEVKNYLDYFQQYINLRIINKEYIKTSLYDGKIDSLKVFLKIIRNDFLAVTNKRLNYSKWSHTSNEKHRKYYCQPPYKQTLKYLVLVLDMSESEAKACFNFFCYGLAIFNREDATFLRMIRTKKKARKIEEINAILIHRFGKKASLYYTGK